MAHYEQTYWWHLGRLRIIETFLKKARGQKRGAKILNIGCGTGGTIDTLEHYGTVDNVDISDEAIAFVKQKGYKNLTKVSDITLPFASKTYDVVGAFDVLEHIEEEVAALEQWKLVLKDDGAIVLTVPAYQWLWSDHDVSLHHKRRYTISRLQKAADAAGLRLERKSYAIVFSLPLIVGFRVLNKILGRKGNAETSYVAVPEFVNKLFTRMLFLEAWTHSHIAFPFGTSVVAILKKK